MTSALTRRFFPSLPALMAQALLNGYGAAHAPAPPRLFLTIPEAARYSGLSTRLLRRLIDRKQLRVVPDRPIKIARADLEQLAVNGKSLAVAGDELRRVVQQRKARR
jgi:hypothetical protein